MFKDAIERAFRGKPEIPIEPPSREIAPIKTVAIGTAGVALGSIATAYAKDHPEQMNQAKGFIIDKAKGLGHQTNQLWGKGTEWIKNRASELGQRIEEPSEIRQLRSERTERESAGVA